MKCKERILGIDIGTTSVSGVAVDGSDGRVLRGITRAHGADVAGLPAGWHEQSPVKLAEVTFGLAQELCDGEPAAGIVFTGQMHGVVVVDDTLAPLTNLITWRDGRAADAAETVRRHAYAADTGCFLHPGYGALTLRHLDETGTLPAHAHKALTIQGYAQALLTGECVIDETSAAGLGVWDTRRGCWHDALIAALGFPRGLLPEFAPSAAPCGRVRAGFGALSGAVIYGAVADNQAGVIGARGSRGDEAVVNVGTSGQVSVPRQTFRFAPALETRPMPGGGFIQVFATLCGGWAYQYLADFFRQVAEELTGAAPTREATLDLMARLAEEGGSEGLRVDPRFAGERGGAAAQSGMVYGITPRNLTPRNLIHAFAEGLANELAAPLDMTDVRGIVAVGNAVRLNPVLRRAIEHRFGVPCRLSEADEAAAFGAVRAVLENKTRRGS